MTKQELVTAVKKWRSTHHPKTYDENWYIQNLLGDILGWNTPEQEEISKLFMPPKPMNDEQIEKKLKDIFLTYGGQCIVYYDDDEAVDHRTAALYTVHEPQIKEVLAQARKDERQAVIEKIKGIISEDDSHVCNERCEANYPGCTERSYVSGYNFNNGMMRAKLAQLEKE